MKKTLKLLGVSLMLAGSFAYAHTFKLANTIKNLGPMVPELNAECKYYSQFVNFINPDQLKKWMDEGKNFTIVDVRTQDEMKAGEINWPDYDEYPRGVVDVYAAMGVLKKNHVYVFLCSSGHRAVLAGGELVKWFHFPKKNIYVLRGGLDGWLAAGYPIVNKVTDFGGFKGLKAVCHPKEPVVIDRY
jgi:rhodanese-related sulfurtransferase